MASAVSSVRLSRLAAPAESAPVTSSVPPTVALPLMAAPVKVVLPAVSVPEITAEAAARPPDSVRLAAVIEPSWFTRTASVSMPNFTWVADATCHTFARLMVSATVEVMMRSSPWADVCPHCVFRTPLGPAEITISEGAAGVATGFSQRQKIQNFPHGSSCRTPEDTSITPTSVGVPLSPASA